MKITPEQLTQKGFIVNGFEIQEISYADYLREYGADETTSPKGIAPRIHIRERNVLEYRNVETKAIISEDDYSYLDESEQDNYEMIEDRISYQVWTWGISGNHPSFTGQEYGTEEESEIDVYEHFQFYIQEKNWDAPAFLDSEAEAIKDIADREEKPVAVIERYQSFLKIAAKRKAKEQEAIREFQFKQREAVKAEALILTPLIDEEFKSALQASGNMTGNAKSDYLASVFKKFLERKNYGRVKSDFWKVFRILKSNF